jgi:hypothetical protein
MVSYTIYFDNVDHTILFELLDRKIHDERIKDLTTWFVSVFGLGNRWDWAVRYRRYVPYYPLMYMDKLYNKLLVFNHKEGQKNE